MPSLNDAFLGFVSNEKVKIAYAPSLEHEHGTLMTKKLYLF